MTPRLSILIPSIPSRWNKAHQLYDHLQELCKDKRIEILLLMDNKKRTIGEKREALKNASNGKYFMFVDDDDSLYSVKEIYEATANDVDVITFKSKCRNSDGTAFIVTPRLGSDIEHNTEQGRYVDCNRPPFPNCAWSAHFKKYSYPASNYGEDWEWVKQCLPTAFLETHIPLILHGYNFDPEVSEAAVGEVPHIIDMIRGPSLLMNQPIIGPTKRCVVNVATQQYWKGQERLTKAMQCQNVETFAYKNEYEVGAPSHSDNPYAFKIYAIDAMREKGYDQILWLDASVYAVKDPKPVFDWIDKHGYFMEEAGHYVGQWCNDRTLEYFELTREQAMQIPMFSGGFIGLDFRNPEAVTFFSRWKNAMLNGMFKGDWSNHRHDMTCGSIIAYAMGLRYSSGGTYFSYVGPGYGEPSTTSVFHLSGQP